MGGLQTPIFLRMKFIVLLLFCVTCLGQTPGDGPAEYVKLNLVNSSNAVVVTLFYAFNGEDPVGSADRSVSLLPGETKEYLLQFPANSAVTHFEAWRASPSPAVEKFGASYVVGGSSAANIPLGRIAIHSPDAPYPRISFYLSEQAAVLADGQKTVWEVSDSSLTGQLFMHGVDKLLAGQSVASSGSSGLSDKGKSLETFHYDLLTGASLPSDTRTRSDTAVTNMTTAFGNVSRQGQLYTATTPTASDSFWVVSMPIGGGGSREIDLNPLHVDGVSEIFQWVRLVISVIILWWFEVFCWNKFEEVSRSAAAGTQARGNTVAGSGGQITSTLNASVIAVIFVSLPGAMFAIYTSSFVVISAIYPDAVSSVDVLPSGSNFLNAAFFLLNAFFPTTLLLIVLAQTFVVRKGSYLVFWLSQVVIKFVNL